MTRYLRPWKRVDDKDIWKQWRAGKTPAIIAAERGCSRQTIYRAIRRAETIPFVPRQGR